MDAIIKARSTRAIHDLDAAKQLKGRLEAKSVTVTAKAGTGGRLFGAVSGGDVDLDCDDHPEAYLAVTDDPWRDEGALLLAGDPPGALDQPLVNVDTGPVTAPPLACSSPPS